MLTSSTRVEITSGDWVVFTLEREAMQTIAGIVHFDTAAAIRADALRGDQSLLVPVNVLYGLARRSDLV